MMHSDPGEYPDYDYDDYEWDEDDEWSQAFDETQVGTPPPDIEDWPDMPPVDSEDTRRMRPLVDEEEAN